MNVLRAVVCGGAVIDGLVFEGVFNIAYACKSV